MKVTVIDGAVVATSETVEEAAILIKFTKKVETPKVTGTPVVVGKRGRRSKFATEGGTYCCPQAIQQEVGQSSQGEACRSSTWYASCYY